VTHKYLTTEEVAHRYRTTPAAVHHWTSQRTIPHIKRRHQRRSLYPTDWLDTFDEGCCELEIIDLGDGGRMVRPVGV
jgi:hypothetical protein